MVDPPWLFSPIPISARASGPDVRVQNLNGTVDVRSGGSRSWRNNNPGNIRSGGFAARQGAIGQAGGFAVFPSERAGKGAVVGLLNTPGYQSQTLNGAIARWAPSSDNNNTAAYQDDVQRQTGLPGSASMSALSQDELGGVAEAIKGHEGWRGGTVTRVQPE